MASRLAAPPTGWPLAAAANALGLALDVATTDKLGRWLDLLVTWNARVDLTAARGVDELVDLMLADAVVLTRYVASGATVVDVGTGAGAPGLALAILRPDLRITLVEPLAKRASFLRSTLGSLDRLDVSIETAKGAALASAGRTWGTALARATLAPAIWLALGAGLVPPAGSVFVFLAKEPVPSDPRMSVADDVEYAWPLTGVSRRLVRFTRLA